MAATKIFPITDTTHKALAYIAADNKTDNGRFVSTFMCSRDPDKAAKEFAEVTATETGRSTVLTEYGQIRSQVLELYSSGHIPTVEALKQKINALIGERSGKDLQFREADKQARGLVEAQRTVEKILRHERNAQEKNRKRKKSWDME